MANSLDTWTQSQSTSALFYKEDFTTNNLVLSGSNALIFFNNADNISMYYSTDVGQTWTASQSTTSTLFTGNFICNAPLFLSGSNAIGSFSRGDKNFIYYSTDSGANWTASLSNNLFTGLSITNLVVSGENAILVLGGYTSNGTLGTNLIYYSNDGGANWIASQSNNSFTTLANNNSLQPGCTLAMSGNNAICIFSANFPNNNFFIYYSVGTSESPVGESWTQSNNYTSLPTSTTISITGFSFNFLTMSGENAIANGFDNYNNGYIYYSIDGGANWILSSSEDLFDYNIDVLSLAMSGSNAIITFNDDYGDFYVYYSIDGGASWILSSSNDLFDDFDFVSLAMSGSNAIAVGNNSSPNGVIYNSIDGGNTWSKSNFNTQPKSLGFNACSISGENAISLACRNVVTDANLYNIIYYSTPPPSPLATWYQSTPARPLAYKGKKDFTRVKFGEVPVDSVVSGKKAIVAGVSNSNNSLTIYYSRNVGETWNLSDFPSDTSTVFRGLMALRDDYAIVIGKKNNSDKYTIYYSTNAGKNWNVSNLIDKSNRFTNVVMSSNPSGYYAIATDDSPSIWYSYSDGSQSVGETWKRVDLPGPTAYTNLVMSGPNAIVSVEEPTGDYTIYYSYNGGQTWNANSDFPVSNVSIRLLSISGKKAIVFLRNGTIVYSNNLQNWTTSDFTTTDIINNMSMSGKYAILVGGTSDNSKAVIYNSVDGGATWTQVLSINDFYFVSCAMSGKYAIAVGGDLNDANGIIFYSENYGKSWRRSVVIGDSSITHFRCSLSGEHALSVDRNLDVFYSKPRPVVCYVKGTLILTKNGWKPIEEIKKGTKVLTKGKIQKLKYVDIHAESQFTPVLWASKFKVTASNNKSYPICIKKDALGENIPFKDLYVSPNHGLLINGKRVVAKKLINETTIYQDKTWKEVEYYHLECDKHCAIFANGALSESYLNEQNRFVFENKIEPQQSMVLKKAK